MRIRVNSDVYLEWMSRVAYAQVEVSQMNESFLTYEFERHVNEVWTILKFGCVSQMNGCVSQMNESCRACTNFSLSRGLSSNM